MNRRLTGLLVTATLLTTAAHATGFPKMISKEPNVLVCRYLLSSRMLTYSLLKHQPIEMTKLPQCITLPQGTTVIAEDTDGGAFIGVTLPRSDDSRSIWWTYQGWFLQEVQ